MKNKMVILGAAHWKVLWGTKTGILKFLQNKTKNKKNNKKQKKPLFY